MSNASEKRVVAVVLMADGTTTSVRPRPRPALLDRLPRGSVYIRFAALSHGNFNAVEGLLPALVHLSTVQPWTVAGRDAQLGYETIASATLYYLDARWTNLTCLPQRGNSAVSGQPYPPAFLTCRATGRLTS